MEVGGPRERSTQLTTPFGPHSVAERVSTGNSTYTHMYTARIELHSSKFLPDFVTLHRQMAFKGFSKSVLADDGKEYNLPRGHYAITTSEDIGSVLNKARSAVTATGQTAEIFVSATSHWLSYGLTEKS